jgi:multiple sugar transport system permease protein
MAWTFGKTLLGYWLTAGYPLLVYGMKYRSRLHLLLLPYLLGTILLVILPALFSFGLAFFRYDTLSPPEWVGILNFRLVYYDELFLLSITNSLALVLLPAPLRIVGAFLLALLLWRGGRGLGWFRGAVFMPTVMPNAAYVLAWLWILNPLFGPLNLTLRAIGLDAPAWLVDPEWAKIGLALATLWQIGEGFVVALAALHDIPRDVEDAARVDGANTFQFTTSIVIPLVTPILFILLLRDAILLLQESFVSTYLLTDGGPYYATTTLPYFVHEQAFDLFSFGTAGAALWVLYGIAGAVVLALYTIGKSWGVATDDEALVL